MEQRMTRLVTLALTPVAFLVASANAQTITQADLINRLIDLDRLSQPPAAGERSGLFSSFDRASKTVQNGKYVSWDANNDFNQFAGKSNDGWDVCGTIDGPGAITRMWCGKLAGEIRIVVDGKPVVAGKIEDLFKGGIAPLGEPLTYVVSGEGKDAGVSYFPIGCAKSMVIQSRGFDGAYQVDTLAFGAGTQVASFSADLDGDALKAIDAVSKVFKNGLTEKQLFPKRAA